MGVMTNLILGEEFKGRVEEFPSKCFINLLSGKPKKCKGNSDECNAITRSSTQPTSEALFCLFSTPFQTWQRTKRIRQHHCFSFSFNPDFMTV